MTYSFDNQAEESLGMAQTFSVVTTLIECIAEAVENRIKQKQAVKAKKEADEEEVSRAFLPTLSFSLRFYAVHDRQKDGAFRELKSPRNHSIPGDSNSTKNGKQRRKLKTKRRCEK